MVLWQEVLYLTDTKDARPEREVAGHTRYHPSPGERIILTGILHLVSSER